METEPDSQVLLVEGHNDRKVVEHLLEAHGECPEQHFKIEDKGGFDPLHESITVHVKAPGLKTLGILVDANDNLNARWQSISDQLSRDDRAIQPQQPKPGGNVFPLGPQGPRIGIWLMPDNQVTGELEDFIHGLIPGNDPVWPRAKDYIDSIPKKDRKFKDRKRIRAYVHAWLAACEKPRPMGLAISTGDLDKNAAGAVRFVGWLRTLFQF